MVWKKLTSVLSPRDRGGIKAFSVVLSPSEICRATKADQDIEEREDQMMKLHTQYNQELMAKMKVAVMSSMLP